MTSSDSPRDRKRAGRALLGLCALGLFAGATWTTWLFLTGSFHGGVPVKAFFSAPGIGQQLREGGDVKVRGVLVGRIAEIALTEDGAVLELALDPEVRLNAEAALEIRSKTIFGEKWVELIPPAGVTTGPFLVAGSEIPDDRTQEPLELERALQLGHDLLAELPLDDLARLLSSLADGFGGSEASARTAIDDGLVALRAVNSRSGQLDLSLRQLNEFSAWLDDNSDDLVSFASSLDSANRALVGAAPEFRSSLDSVPTFLDRLASFQERTEADLGRLSESGADVAEIVAARSDRLVDLIVQLEAFTTVWNSGLEQPCEGEFETDLTCWQVYQLPGMESRGLYGRSGGPLAGDPGDPGSVVATMSPDEAIASLLEDRVGRKLARLIVASALGEFTSELGGRP